MYKLLTCFEKRQPIRTARLPSIQNIYRRLRILSIPMLRTDPIPLTERHIILRIKVVQRLVEAVSIVFEIRCFCAGGTFGAAIGGGEDLLGLQVAERERVGLEGRLMLLMESLPELDLWATGMEELSIFVVGQSEGEGKERESAAGDEAVLHLEGR